MTRLMGDPRLIDTRCGPVEISVTAGSGGTLAAPDPPGMTPRVEIVVGQALQPRFNTGASPEVALRA